MNIGINVPWPQWLQGLHAYHGIAHDKGFIPLHAIKLIVHLDIAGEPENIGQNVVPFRKPT